MKHFLRPYRSFGFLGLGLFVLVAAGVAPAAGCAQSTQMVELMPGTSPLLLHAASQGYLGVWVDDIDADKAQTLKLKEVRGAVITLIDHDAPAGSVGLRINDVVLQFNGQDVEGAEQLRRMLREIPPGHRVSLEFSRDGNIQTISVEMSTHRAVEIDAQKKLKKNDGGFAQNSGGMSMMPGAGDASLPGMFHMSLFGGTLNVGAMVEPLVGQTAEFLGVSNGLMVKQVARKSEAAAAGLKAKDIILKVGPDAIATLSDWDRALRSNQGKQVQVTILRDGRQQTVTLQVDSSKRKTGSLNLRPMEPVADSSPS